MRSPPWNRVRSRCFWVVPNASYAPSVLLRISRVMYVTKNGTFSFDTSPVPGGRSIGFVFTLATFAASALPSSTIRSRTKFRRANAAFGWSTGL